MNKILLYFSIIFFLTLIIFIIHCIIKDYLDKKRFTKTKSLYSKIKNNDIKLPYVEESKDIPLNIIQTHKSIDLVPKQIIDKLKKDNPDHKYYFYDNEECKLFLRNTFGKQFEEKFNEFKLGPHKSDLFRICWLYINGGTYIDIDTEMLKPLNYIHKNIKSNLIIPKNNFKSNIYNDKISNFFNVNHYSLINSFIMCNKGNKKIGECIKNIIQLTQKDIDKHGYTIILSIMQRTLGKDYEYQIFEKEESKYKIFYNKKLMYDKEDVVLMNPKYENYKDGIFKL